MVDVHAKCFPISDTSSHLLCIGGILCESTCSSMTDFDVTIGKTRLDNHNSPRACCIQIDNCPIGVGLNISNEQPTTCLNSLRDPNSPLYTREAVLADFLNTFEAYINRFRGEGFAPFLHDYLSSWMHRYHLCSCFILWIMLATI